MRIRSYYNTNVEMKTLRHREVKERVEVHRARIQTLGCSTCRYRESSCPRTVQITCQSQLWEHNPEGSSPAPRRLAGSSTCPLCEFSRLLALPPSPPSPLVQPMLHSGGDSPPPQNQTKGGLWPQKVHCDTAQGQHLAGRSRSGVSRTQVCT